MTDVSFVNKMKSLFCPGVSLVVLTLASIYFVSLEHPFFPEKVAWLLVFAALGCLEIAAIYQERRSYEIHTAALREDSQQKFRITLAQFRNLAHLAQLGPKRDLKRRALELSDELLSLVYGLMFRPSDPESGKGLFTLAALLAPSALSTEQKRYLGETFRRGKEVEKSYRERYSAKVLTIRTELSEHGIVSEDLNRWLDNAHIDYIHVMLIGEELGALTERLEA